MELNLAGKNAVVTGASRGIGLAVAQSLAAEGVNVVGAARTVTPELEAVASLAVSADLSTRAGTAALMDAALAHLDGIDILVNNVGAGDPDRLGLGGFLEVDDQQWDDLFALNLFSAVWTSRAALPSLLERRGAIINVSSVNAYLPAEGSVGYSEAKAALRAFGKRLSAEFGPRGVRVNTVSPGSRWQPVRCGAIRRDSADWSRKPIASVIRISSSPSRSCSVSLQDGSPSPKKSPR